MAPTRVSKIIILNICMTNQYLSLFILLGLTLPCTERLKELNLYNFSQRYNQALHNLLQYSIAVLHTSPKRLTDCPVCLQTSIATLQTSPNHLKHSTEWIK